MKAIIFFATLFALIIIGRFCDDGSVEFGDDITFWGDLV
jgi:hypothetical protein